MLGNGVPALRPGETKDEISGYVVVDERAAEVGTDHRVLAEVKIPLAKMNTYRLCERIFDNYALERTATEIKYGPKKARKYLISSTRSLQRHPFK